MTKIAGFQLSLIAESDFEDRPVGDWDYDELGTNKSLVPNSLITELGTNKFLVPNSPLPELGTNKFLVPNSPLPELGTNKFLVPNSDNWQPPIGGFQQKWIKDHQYWYWRYYDNRGKKASLYLHKDYNQAVLKAKRIGVPLNAKPVKVSSPKTNTQIQAPPQFHPLHLAPTTQRTSRAA